MKNFFNYDGTLNRLLTKLMYIVSLNLLFLVCSVPIVTIGASAAAMYSVLMGYLREEEPEILKGFFRAFKDNFKKATLVWLLMLMVAVTLGSDFYALYQSGFALGGIIRILLNLILVLLFVLWVYIFPTIAYFDNTLKGYLTFSVGIAIAKLPATIWLVMIQTIPILGVLFLAQYFPAATLVLLCCAASLPAYYSCKTLLRLFHQYEG